MEIIKYYKLYKKLASINPINRNLPISVYWEEVYKSSGFWFISTFFILIVLFALLYQIWILLSIIFIFYLILTEMHLGEIFILKFGRILKAQIKSINYFENHLDINDEQSIKHKGYDILIEYQLNNELHQRISVVKYGASYYAGSDIEILFLEQTNTIILYPELSNNQQNIFLEEIKSLDL